MSLNEADTRRVYITPALKRAGWGAPLWRMTEQHYFTAGQIHLVGDGHGQARAGRRPTTCCATASPSPKTISTAAGPNVLDLRVSKSAGVD
jgi:hypothetical protein